MKTRNVTARILALWLALCPAAAGMEESFFEEVSFSGAPFGEETFEETFSEEFFGAFDEDPFADPDGGLFPDGADLSGAGETDEASGEADLSARSVLMIPNEAAEPDESWQRAPLAFAASARRSVNEAQLSWALPEGLEALPAGVSYYVYELDGATGAAKEAGHTAGTSLVVKGLTEGDHTFFVRAEAADALSGAERYGESSEPLVWTVTGSALWKKKPSLWLTQPAAKTVRLNITVQEPADAYRIQRKVSGKWKTVKTLEAAGQTSLSFTVAGLKAGTKRTYRVVPVKGGKTGSVSAAKTITVKAAWRAKPTGLRAVQTGALLVRLTWNAAGEAKGYRVFVDGKAAAASSILERSATHAVVRVAKTGSHTFNVQPWTKDSKGKTVYGDKSGTLKFTVAGETALGVTDAAAEWEDGVLTVRWTCANPEAASFDVFLWRGALPETEAERTARVPAGAAREARFEDLEPALWSYCVRMNTGDDPETAGRRIGAAGTYDVSQVPPVLDSGEAWRITGGEYEAAWHSVQTPPAYLVELDGAVLALAEGRQYTLTDLQPGDHALRVACADAEGNAASRWSEARTVHVREPIGAALSADAETVLQGRTAVFTARAEKGRGDYRYAFVLTAPDGTETRYEETEENTLRAALTQEGTYTATVRVTDGADTEGAEAGPVTVAVTAALDADGITYAVLREGGAETLAVRDYAGGAAAVVRPEVDGIPVTRVEAGAFAGHAELNAVTIPDGVTELEEGWHEGCGEALLVRCGPDGAARAYAVSHGLDFDCGGKRRVLILAEDYEDNRYLPTLQGPPNDAAALAAAFSRWGFETTVRRNLTSQGILSEIGTVFAGATENDISVVTYSGHGDTDGSLIGSNYAGSDATGRVRPAALAAKMAEIPGRKVLILDSCYAGNILTAGADGTALAPKAALRAAAAADGALPEETEETDGTDAAAEAFPEAFIGGILDAFRAAPAAGTDGLRRMARSSSAVNRTYIMAAAAADREAYEDAFSYGGETKQMGYFTHFLCWGLGWNGVSEVAIAAYADAAAGGGNGDGAVSFAEGFEYAKTRVRARLGDRESSQASPEDERAFAPWRHTD